MKLTDLHEQFIDLANRPMDFGGPPVKAQRPVPVIVPVERWTTTSTGLSKRFQFRRPEDRTRFITDMLEYEEQVQHHAQMTIREGEVVLLVITKDVERVTELDTEYSRYADAVFKDIVFSP